jgi:hypothetical protein
VNNHPAPAQDWETIWIGISTVASAARGLPKCFASEGCGRWHPQGDPQYHGHFASPIAIAHLHCVAFETWSKFGHIFRQLTVTRSRRISQSPGIRPSNQFDGEDSQTRLKQLSRQNVHDWFSRNLKVLVGTSCESDTPVSIDLPGFRQIHPPFADLPAEFAFVSTELSLSAGCGC